MSDPYRSAVILMAFVIIWLLVQNRKLRRNCRGKVLRSDSLPVGMKFKVAHVLHPRMEAYTYLVLECTQKKLWKTFRIFLLKSTADISTEIVANHPLIQGDVVEAEWKDVTAPHKGKRVRLVRLNKPVGETPLLLTAPRSTFKSNGKIRYLN